MVSGADEQVQCGEHCGRLPDPKFELVLTTVQPALPHSFLFGHLMVMGKAMAAYPADL